MRIANNILALNAFNSLSRTGKSLEKSIRSLSTGLRINSASDDAAGFAVSEKMRSQIRGLDTALRNSQDGISLLQTAEGALEQTNSMLQRMRDLSIQASNDSLTSNDRQYIQLEIDELKKQIDQIAGTTQFNKKRILDGSSGALWASSDPGVKVRVNGGLTRTDNFEQKVSAEGNYRIEVKANPGQAQVQKSNIMMTSEYGITVEVEKIEEPIIQTVYEIETVTETVTETVKEMQRIVKLEPITTTKEVDHIIRLNQGIDSLNETSGEGWAFENGSLVITGSGTYDIRGTGAPTSTNIIVKSGATANIFLTDVNIDKSNSSQAGMEIESGATAKVYLTNSNTLRGGRGRASLEVAKGATLYLSSADGDGETSGTLNAISSAHGAGIGGGGSPAKSDGRAGSIYIYGGTIEAKAKYGAGIGGGESSADDGCDLIAIYGGNVTAWGGVGSAGIGTGYYPDFDILNKKYTSANTEIIIAGGTVKAYGGTFGASGAGIGGGGYSSSGTITINKKLLEDGDVVAVSGGTGAERIGHGTYGNQTEDTNINLEADVTPTYNAAPSRPKITAEVEDTQERVVYEEVEVPRTREVTRQIQKKVDKVVGTRVVDEIPYVKGLNGDFVYKPKKLTEIPTFYNSEGVCIAEPYQTVKITQGDGKTASVTLYPTDTMDDVSRKINDAIAGPLGQGKVAGNINKFCTMSDGTEGTSESVYAREPIYSEEGYLSEYGFDIPAGTLIGYKISNTMLVRSAIPGKDGELYFSGDEELLNALGLNTIQESTESRFTASVYDAHSGVKINTMTAEGTEFKSIIPPEIDIDIDPMTTAISANWDESTKRFIFGGNDDYMTMLHLKDNGITFHTGANMGEDFSIQLGDMSCSALGISRVNLATRESASRSIGIIDRAISRVSSQRAKIGAYINGLEHTMTNLTTTSANLTGAESRIRDTDMAEAMMNFVKYQILNQSGTSMLAQANQIPQSVLSMLQG